MLIEKLNRVAKSETLLFNAAPRVLCWPAALIVWGPGFFSVKHKHHSVKLVMAIEGELRIRRGPPQKWTECRATRTSRRSRITRSRHGAGIWVTRPTSLPRRSNPASETLISPTAGAAASPQGCQDPAGYKGGPRHVSRPITENVWRR